VDYDGRLNHYVRELHAAGTTYTGLVLKLAVEEGYTVPMALRIVDAALRHDGSDSDGGTLSYDPPHVSRRLPAIDTSSRQSVLHLPGADAAITFEQLAPRIVVLDNFLSPQECDGLCQEALPAFAPARVVDEHEHAVHAAQFRSNDSAQLPASRSALVGRIEARIERLTGWPSAFCETLQVQRYAQGQDYRPHHDFFDKGSAAHEAAEAHGGQRLATLILYLKEPEAGGATYFANLGVRIAPRKGSALFFTYPDPGSNSGTLHGGEAVLAGEKWIATQWFRERAWRNPQAGHAIQNPAAHNSQAAEKNTEDQT
jgi:prolyl 4-hydroxylase